LPESTESPSVARIEGVLLAIAVAVAAIVVVDNVTYDLANVSGHIKGADYLVLGGAVGYLVTALLARKWAKKLAVSIVIGLPVWLLIEAMMGLAGGMQRTSPWYIWPPGCSLKTEPHSLVGVSSEGQFHTNSRGIRGPEFSPQDRLRILCIGGSTTECVYLDDAKTWPARLSQSLAERTSGVWVGNVGRSGLKAVDHVTLVNELPEAQMVDYWLVLMGVNDLGQQINGTYASSAASTWHQTFAYRRPGLSLQLRRPLQRNLFLVDCLDRLRKRVSLLFEERGLTVYQDVQAIWMDDLRSQRKQARISDGLPDLVPFLSEYEQQIMRLIQAARRSGKTIVFATQPLLYHENMTAQERNQCLFMPMPDGTMLAIEKALEAMRLYNDRLKEVCRREGVLCIDLANRITPSLDVFYDDCHFNEAGAVQVADILAGELAAAVARDAADGKWRR
jgi:lysophospholipase L1-like esterase